MELSMKLGLMGYDATEESGETLGGDENSRKRAFEN